MIFGQISSIWQDFRPDIRHPAFIGYKGLTSCFRISGQFAIRSIFGGYKKFVKKKWKKPYINMYIYKVFPLWRKQTGWGLSENNNKRISNIYCIIYTSNMYYIYIIHTALRSALDFFLYFFFFLHGWSKNFISRSGSWEFFLKLGSESRFSLSTKIRF